MATLVWFGSKEILVRNHQIYQLQFFSMFCGSDD